MDDDRQPAPSGHQVRGSSTGRPLMVLLDLLGRRWTLRVIWELHLSAPHPLTFRALQERCADMSSSVLNQRLGDLREAQLVTKATAGYTLTDHGAQLVERFLPLDAWADGWAKQLVENVPTDASPTNISRTSPPRPPSTFTTITKRH